MIPSNQDRKTEGNLVGDRIQVTVDQEATAHIISMMIDQYSDPELACIREYSTNARDSHVEAGQTKPIEVQLPGALSPYLKIKDYGVGLSVDEIHDIYSKIGASTKRGTNDATGMLGIGCKSAVSYASQFTMVAIKDGVRATVAISREADNTASMTIVDTAATDQPNGVEISIPARAGNEFASKAAKFFKHWPGRVLDSDKARAGRV